MQPRPLSGMTPTGLCGKIGSGPARPLYDRDRWRLCENVGPDGIDRRAFSEGILSVGAQAYDISRPGFAKRPFMAAIVHELDDRSPPHRDHHVFTQPRWLADPAMGTIRLTSSTKTSSLLAAALLWAKPTEENTGPTLSEDSRLTRS